MADPDASPGGRLSCVVDLHTVLVPSQRTLTWKLFISDALPDLLGAAGTSSDKITRIAADIERRAQDYASGGRAARRALRVPFTDDVATFQPVEAPVGVRADAAVVVRNSLLEDEHARGAVEDSDLTSIMTLATGALNEWLRMNSNTAEHTPPVRSLRRRRHSRKGLRCAASTCCRSRDRRTSIVPHARCGHTDSAHDGSAFH